MILFGSAKEAQSTQSDMGDKQSAGRSAEAAGCQTLVLRLKA